MQRIFMLHKSVRTSSWLNISKIFNLDIWLYNNFWPSRFQMMRWSLIRNLWSSSQSELPTSQPSLTWSKVPCLGGENNGCPFGVGVATIGAIGFGTIGLFVFILNFLFIFSQMIETFFQMIFCQSKNNLNQRNFMSQSASSNSDSSH